MTTDHAKLLKTLQSESGKKYPANMTLTKLISLVDTETGNLQKKVYIPEYEVNKEFLLKVLEELGYSVECTEEYNSYFEQFCYIIKLSR